MRAALAIAVLVLSACADDGAGADSGPDYMLGGVCPSPYTEATSRYPWVVCDHGAGTVPRFTSWDSCLTAAGLPAGWEMLSWGCNHPDATWAMGACPRVRVGPDPVVGLARLQVCSDADAAATFAACRARVDSSRCMGRAR